MTGGPIQDDFDQQTANIATMFLGISHVNCLLCHNGRGHLDALSLWGSQTTRYQAWQLASYLSHTQPKNVPVRSRRSAISRITGASATTRPRPRPTIR